MWILTQAEIEESTGSNTGVGHVFKGSIALRGISVVHPTFTSIQGFAVDSLTYNITNMFHDFVWCQTGIRLEDLSSLAFDDKVFDVPVRMLRAVVVLSELFAFEVVSIFALGWGSTTLAAHFEF